MVCLRTMMGLIAGGSLLQGASMEQPAEAAREAASRGYDEEFIDLVEVIYGEGFLSQGGKASIDRMVQGADLSGKKVLDLGSGIGAPDLYLASRYTVDVIGLEPQEWMVRRARTSLGEKEANLKGTVRFEVMVDPSHLRPFEDQSFDVVFSKESILHVPLDLKKTYFEEIFRVMKKGGELVLMDWMRGAPTYSASTQRMFEMDGMAFNLLTPIEYLSLLREVGFQNVSMENTTRSHAAISKENIETIRKKAAEIKQRFGENVYEYCIESWGYQRDAFESEELMVGIFRAEKPQ